MDAASQALHAKVDEAKAELQRTLDSVEQQAAEHQRKIHEYYEANLQKAEAAVAAFGPSPEQLRQEAAEAERTAMAERLVSRTLLLFAREVALL